MRGLWLILCKGVYKYTKGLEPWVLFLGLGLYAYLTFILLLGLYEPGVNLYRLIASILVFYVICNFVFYFALYLIKRFY